MGGDTPDNSNVARRRRVLKAAVGGTLVGAGVTGGAVVLTRQSPPRGTNERRTYVGIDNVAGPTPRGLPQIPIDIDADGFVKGVWPTDTDDEGTPAMTIGNVTYSSRWFHYCDHTGFPGLRPGAEQDNFFRVARGTPYDWEEELSVGDRLRVEDFDDFEDWTNGVGRSGLGKPAMAHWRSVDVPSAESITVQVLRSTRIQGLLDADHPLREWIQATTQEGFIAWLSRCPYRCCTPSFKGIAASAEYGGENLAYCPCHGSMYDPFTVTTEPLELPDASDPSDTPR